MSTKTFVTSMLLMGLIYNTDNKTGFLNCPKSFVTVNKNVELQIISDTALCSLTSFCDEASRGLALWGIFGALRKYYTLSPILALIYQKALPHQYERAYCVFIKRLKMCSKQELHKFWVDIRGCTLMMSCVLRGGLDSGPPPPLHLCHQKSLFC